MKRLMKTLIAVIAVGTLAATFTACEEDNNPQEVPSCGGFDPATGCPATIEYEGKPLHCVSWDGSHGETGLTCDFTRYWKENPR